MKRIALFVLLAAVTGGILFAQTAPATTTVTGTVGLSAGRIVVKSGTTIYYTRGLQRLVGFIEDLKDGAQVIMEGYVSNFSMESETEKLFSPVKLTLNGKTYDVGSERTAIEPMGYGRRGRGRRW